MPGTSRRAFLRRGFGTATACAAAGRVPGALAGRDQAVAPGWDAVRSEFLVAPGHAYLNTATLGTPPRSAIDELARCYRELAADPEPRRNELYALVDRSVRPVLARLVSVDPSRIALTTGASESLYIAAAGVPLDPGDEVVYTNLDHPAAVEPWIVRAERSGIVLREVTLPSPFATPAQVTEPIVRAFSPRTRVLSFPHVTRGGFLLPVKELCALARQHGVLTIVDGAQALGMMDVDLTDLGCDVYAGSPHKWLLAPSGNGLLYVRPDRDRDLRSLFAPAAKPVTGARRYEPVGTYALPVRVAMGPALDLFVRMGLRQVETRNRVLSDYLKGNLDGLPRVQRITPMSPEVSSAGITLFEVEGRQADDVQRQLRDRHRIHVDEHARNGREAVRVSTHFYNTHAEIDRLVDAVRVESSR